MLTPQDYCVSLAMAQRPELHAAMVKAGCDKPDWGYLSGGLVSSDYIYSMPDGPENPWDDPRVTPAFHTGELICAALALAEQTAAYKAGEVDTLKIAIGLHPDNEPGTGVYFLRGCAGLPQTLSPHLPDAIAELVIALAAEGTKC